MILTVYDHERSVAILVPVTPASTFVDVLRCCKGFLDLEYYITGLFQNREERTIDPLEKPYEFVKENVNFMNKFVIYRKDDSIFLRGLNNHQDTKKRFRFTELADFISHHNKVLERQTKATEAMEEKLKKLRKESLMKKREEHGPLTLIQNADIQERKINAIRRQKGHLLPQGPRTSQGSYLGELKICFRTIEEDMKKLKQRVEYSSQKIKTFGKPELLNDLENSKRVLRELNRQCEDKINSVPKTTTDVHKLIVTSQASSRDINLKISDLRNRLNLNKNLETASLGVLRPQIQKSGRSADKIRPKSATEILFNNDQSSSLLPPALSLPAQIRTNDVANSLATIKNSLNVSKHLSGAVEHLIKNVELESKTRILPHNVEDDFLLEKPYLIKKYGSKEVADPADVTVKKSFQCQTSGSKKRRQRPLVVSEKDDVATVVENVCENINSVNQLAATPVLKHSADSVRPIVESYFYKDVKASRVNDDSVPEINSGKGLGIAGNSRKPPEASELPELSALNLSKPVNMSINWNEISEGDKLNVSSYLGKSGENDTSLEASSNCFQGLSDNFSNISIENAHLNPSQEGLSFLHRSPICSSFAQIAPDHSDGNLDLLCSPRTPNISDSFVQVTPMSSDAPTGSDSAVFNVSKDQISFEIYDAKKSILFSDVQTLENTANSPVIKDDLNLPADAGTNEKSFMQEDSFHMIPSFNSVSIDEKEVDMNQFSCAIHDHQSPCKEVTESFPMSTYPYPLTEVLEQLDGGASILRHSIGAIRSQRKRHSLDDFYHHNNDCVPHSATERSSFTCTADIVNDLNEKVEFSKASDISSKGIHAEFKPKMISKQFFSNLPLEAAVASSNEPLSDAGSCVEETSFGEAKSCHSVSNVSLEMDSSPKDFNEGSTSDEEEPGLIIVSGKDSKILEDEYITSSEEDSCTSISDADNGGDDGDNGTSFSSLTGHFNETLEAGDVRFNQVSEKVLTEKDIFYNTHLTAQVPLVCNLRSILRKPSENKTTKKTARVIFSPLAILLDAALHGELDVIKDIINEHDHANMVNDEGITALHNAICAGHSDIVQFLISSGCDVNAADNDLWTPLHCAASCYNVSLVQCLVENGACVFATTGCDGETALEKCDDEEEDGGRCKQYLEEVQSKMMQTNTELYAAYDSQGSENSDELNFCEGDIIILLRPGQTAMSENNGNENDFGIGEGWCFARNKRTSQEGYAPKNYLSLFPRVASR